MSTSDFDPDDGDPAAEERLVDAAELVGLDRRVAARMDTSALVLRLIEAVALPNPSLTFDELIEHTGADEDRLRSLWGALGLALPPADERAFDDVDVEIIGGLAGVARAAAVSDDVVTQMARVIGSSMAHIAEAQLDAFGTSTRDGVADELDPLAAEGFVGELFARILEQVWRRHLQAAARARAIHRADPGPTLADRVVGFADLVGFTALSQQLEPAALSAVIARFEAVAFATIGSHGGRVVKMIGDEVMFTIDDPVDAVRCALDLATLYHQADDLSDVRVGMAYGSVIERAGDIFGPTVNLASRITGIAFPDSVVIGADLHDAVAGIDEFAFRSMSARRLKDIGRVTLWVVRRRDDETSEDEERRLRRAERRAQRRHRVAELLGDPD